MKSLLLSVVAALVPVPILAEEPTSMASVERGTLGESRGMKETWKAEAAVPEEWPSSGLVDSPPPEVILAGRVINPIDAFVWQKLEVARLTLAPQADRRTLARRLCFDLIGLPPTPDQVEVFVNNNDPNGYGNLVESLLADEFEEIMGAGELPLAKPEQAVALAILRLAPFTGPRGGRVIAKILA